MWRQKGRKNGKHGEDYEDDDRQHRPLAHEPDGAPIHKAAPF
jgi:hypothetical protein